MEHSAKPSRALNADEVAELGPPPDADAETPTTSLIDLKSQSTAEAHFPGIASSAKSAAEYDTIPDPAPVISGIKRTGR
jgi:hypothetical protein